MKHTSNSATGVYRVRGSRVSLDSVVYRFLEGLSPESIATDCFPVLTLEEVYRVITYYLAHRAEVDAYLWESDAQYDSFRERVGPGYLEAHRRFDAILQNGRAFDRVSPATCNSTTGTARLL